MGALALGLLAGGGELVAPDHRQRDPDRDDHQRGPDQVGDVIARDRRGIERFAVGDERGGALARDRREHREPDRASDLDGRVDEARREPGVAAGRARHRERHQGREGGAGAGAEQDHHRQDVRQIAAVDRRAREPREPGGGEHEPSDQRAPRSEAHDEALRVAQREGPHHDARGKEREADLERAVAEDVLHVESAEEELAEEPDDEQPHDEVRPGDVARPKEAQRHQRVGDPGLAEDERGEQSDRDRAEDERLGRAPALLAGLEQRVDAEHQARRQQRGAGDVGALAEADPRLVLDEAHREQRDRDPDRDVDEEDPMPVDRLGEHAAGEQADRGARGGDEAEDADRLRLLARLGEHHHDHPQDHRRADRSTGALDEAGGDQHLLGLRDRAEQRGRGEDPEADQEDAPLADQVAEAPREQEQAAERDQVGVHDPGEVALGEAEVVLDRRQRDVDDRRVEHDHQQPAAEHVEREPAAIRIWGGELSAGCDGCRVSCHEIPPASLGGVRS